MEKEQKKLLLVAVSVGVFLLVTITVAIILISPRNQPQEAAISRTSPPPVQIQPAQPIIETPVDNTEEIDTYEDSYDGDNLIIQIPSPVTAAVPDNPEIVTVTPPRITPAVTPATTPETTASARPTQPARQNQPSAAANRTPATPSRTVNDYWIQTGAFSARVRAEDAKETLAEKGLVSIIENREINGQVWYRVRLGPYTSENEASYWLSLVKSIDGFGESQIRQTSRRL